MTTIVPHPTPVQTEYYRGFDARVREVFHGEVVDIAALTPGEFKGYRAAMRAQAYAETSAYLVQQRDLAAKYAEVAAAQDSRDASNYSPW